jgi:hypothetical protein
MEKKIGYFVSNCCYIGSKNDNNINLGTYNKNADFLPKMGEIA